MKLVFSKKTLESYRPRWVHQQPTESHQEPTLSESRKAEAEKMIEQLSQPPTKKQEQPPAKKEESKPVHEVKEKPEQLKDKVKKEEVLVVVPEIVVPAPVEEETKVPELVISEVQEDVLPVVKDESKPEEEEFVKPAPRSGRKSSSRRKSMTIE